MKQEYIILLETILDNVENLRETILVLLKRAESLSGESKVKQSLATHAQHFIYLALEELGKFYIILNQYDKNLKNLDLSRVGFYNHDTKIQALLEEIQKTRPTNTQPAQWEEKKSGLINGIRNFKEGNIYIDYKNGKIQIPKPNRGEGALLAMCNILQSGIEMTKINLELFKLK